MEPNYTLFRGVEITTLTLALLFVILRLVNRSIRHKLSFDDAIIVIAAAMAIAITVLVLQLYRFGYGRNDEDIPAVWKIPIGKLSMAIFTTFPLVYTIIRSSIILTYLRIFPAQTNKWFCYILCALQFIYAIWAGLMVLLQCKPVKGYWLADIEKTCIDPKNQDIAILTLNSAFDLVTYLWPAHYLYSLNLPVKQRVGLIVMFSIGIVNIGLSFTRLSLLLVMYRTKQWTKYGIWGCLIIVLESHIGIMCACLPYLRFVYELITSKVYSIGSKSKTRANTRPPNADEDGSHPFQQLSEERKVPPPRKPDITISTLNDEEQEPERPALRRNSLHMPRNDLERNGTDDTTLLEGSPGASK